jgi:hypothetical protein
MDLPSKVAPSPRPPAEPGAAAPRRARPARRHLWLAAIVAGAVAAGLAAFLVLRDGGGAEPGQAAPVSVAVTLAELRVLPEQTGHPVFWAGPRASHTYELTRPTDGNVYVRYLPPGVRPGDERPEFTTIGTYPRPRALESLRRLGRGPAAVMFRVPRGGVAAYGRDRPTSVYVAFPEQDVQVEVYDPSARAARRLARSGQVRPIR